MFYNNQSTTSGYDLTTSWFSAAELNDDINTTSVAVAILPTISPNVAHFKCLLRAKFFLSSLFAGTLCILGFAGNVASFSILGSDRDMLPVARFLLRSLSVVDNLFLLVSFFNFSLVDLFAFTGIDRKYFNRTIWMYIRLTSYPMLFIAQTATIWMTVVVAASRCISVCCPHRASVYCSLTATRIGVAGVAIFSFVYNLPRYFDTTVEHKPPSGNSSVKKAYHRRTAFGSTESYTFIYLDVLYYLVIFAIPLTLLVIFNTTLIVVYQRYRKKRMELHKTSTTSTASSRRRAAESREQNVTLIMIVVVLIFIITNVPAKVVQIVWSYRVHYCPSTAFFVSELSVLFELIGSAINVVVYMLFLQRFRRRLVNAIASRCCCSSPINYPDSEMSISMTVVPVANRHTDSAVVKHVVVGHETADEDASSREIIKCLEQEGNDVVVASAAATLRGGKPVTILECN